MGSQTSKENDQRNLGGGGMTDDNQNPNAAGSSRSHHHHPYNKTYYGNQQQHVDAGNHFNPYRSNSQEGMDIIDATGSKLNSSTYVDGACDQSDGGGSNKEENSATMSDEIVPMVFRWEHGGREVYVTGTFNGWSPPIRMHRSGNDFTFITNLARGKHAYKFLVDEDWRFAPDQPTVADVDGNIQNYVDVSDFVPLAEFSQNVDQVASKSNSTLSQNTGQNSSGFGRFMPDIDDYTKEPPPLPPHLRHIILNKVPPSVDSRLLPVPQHVALNHLYCTAIKDGMMVLGITQRYKQKFVTTVYYSLMPGANT